ncbi:MAG: DUF1540 domain-containing protein [Clostridia bacterium]
MKGLKCTTANCEHNKNCHCYAGIVNISKNAKCNSKIKRSYGMLEQEMENTESAQDFDFNENEDILIQCESTDCIYNKSGLCHSDIINVKDTLFSTKCNTKRNE